jgi:glycosyltransferase involved in cell wall biosynthesis
MESSKRIVFFDFITHYGGAQRSTVLLCSRLKKNYDVQILDAYGFCKPYISDLIANDLTLHILKRKNKNVVIGNAGKPLLRFFSMIRQIPTFAIIAFRLCVRINKIEPDLIWTNSFKALIFLIICKIINGTIIGFYAHGWYRKSQLKWWCRHAIRSQCDVIFAVSNATKKSMVSWGVAARKIYVVYAAMEFERLSIYKKRLTKKRNKIKSDFRILVPASLIYPKGHHTVIETARILKKECKNWNFKVWLAGDTGVGDSSGYKEYLKRQIEDFDLSKEIEFLGWRNDIPELMIRADVVVLPSHTEGLPMVVQEAIMLKRPIITTKVGGIPELISDYTTGYLFEVENAHALSNRIITIHRSSDDIPIMVERAYKRYTRLFNKHIQLKRFEIAINKTLSN